MPLDVYPFWMYTKCMDEKTEKSYSLRIPADLLEEVRAIAQRHNRSVNGEIVTALREYVLRQKKRERGARARKETQDGENI